MTEDEMVGRHHQLNRQEFEQTPGDGEGQRSLECFSPGGHKKSDTTEQLNNNNILLYPLPFIFYFFYFFSFIFISWRLITSHFSRFCHTLT